MRTGRFEPLFYLISPSGPSRTRSSATETSTAAWGALERRGSGPVEELGLLSCLVRSVSRLHELPKESCLPLSDLITDANTKEPITCG